MKWQSLLTIGVLTIGLVTLGWVAPARATSTAAPAAVGGVTFGDWNLPTPGHTGFATGVLNGSTGTTVFKMKAELVEGVSPSLSQRVGTLKGVLDNGSPFPYPMYTVGGTWTANMVGQGTFEALIAKQVSPLGPTILIGKMAGKFADPPSFPDKVGKYKGEWKAVL